MLDLSREVMHRLKFSASAMNSMPRISLVVIAAMLASQIVFAEENKIDAHANGLFAEVDGEAITLQEFQTALNAGMRQRFYHGKIPQEQLKAFRNDVSQSLIDRVLLVKEAKRIGIKPDASFVQNQIKQYENRYQKSAEWAKNKDEILSGLRAAIEEEALVRQLKDQLQNIPEPTDEKVRAFYKKRPDLFTTPEQRKVSVIMLKVAPSAGSEAWAAAQEESTRLVQKIRKGGDFAELARIHSGDESASRGGDMGMMHKGMLAVVSEDAIDKLRVGEVTDPILLLQGIAIFKLDQRIVAELNPYDAVVDRARALLKREQTELAWTEALAALRAKAKIKYHLAGI